ncbi:MAG: DUF5615 family PIN-like protein [Promethearchaeota archaeon]
MKFKIDENLPFILKKLIENVGDHIVDSVFHENLTGIDDKSLILHCLKEERILITLDTDFMKITEVNYGIIILRSKTQGKNAVRSLFQNFLDNFDIENAQGKIIIVELNQIRVRTK